ncbi:hypothetical protein Kfla_5030 [Kribbella flavida DSM 17836]|uniref:Uncharacterized protein n=1 Tax=Kribbella flavida (strain DSM 17836 / JCM 10339 / NBRC 14399) TaxID=479435 RepID=D2Q3C3_KRIFD|nr:CU044_5270 family protein [Kribbella flavida]ADB34046.1 hypothetical protein Kfla_5030 [Kribbella flavida DSM 17836]
MDDLDRIRSAFPEPPAPSPEAAAKARRELQQLISQAQPAPDRQRPLAARSWSATVAADRRHRWYAAARSGRIGIALTATAATVAVAALGVPLLMTPGSGPDAAPVPSTVTPTPRLVTASQVLLDLAVKQEQDEKVSGAYFRVRSLQLRATAEVGRPGQKYRIERRSLTESWMPMKPGVESWLGWLDLGARPATAADTARWKAQGSPRSWQLAHEEDPVTMAPGATTVRKMTFDEVPPGYYLSGEKPVTARQIQALPTDPAVLRAVLARGVQPGATREEIDYTVFCAAGRLLFEMPSPPKLRGAALRVLSKLPGARFKEHVKDPIGRPGTEISFDWSVLGRPTTRSTASKDTLTRYVVDPTTGRLLSSETFGLKAGASVVLESGWTDERPTPPSPTIR